MRHDFFPRRDEDVAPWGKNFSEKLLANYQELGVTLADAQHVAQLYEQFMVKFRANAPLGTRSRVTAMGKSAARQALEKEARRLSRIIHGMPVSDQLKVNLGLSVRTGGGKQSMYGPPQSWPMMQVISVEQRRVKLFIHDSERSGRARPRGVIGAAIFSCETPGDPPNGLHNWRLRGYTTRPRFTVQFEAAVASGAKVWLVAHWLSTRLERGSLSTPIYTHLQGGNAPVFVSLTVLGRAA